MHLSGVRPSVHPPLPAWAHSSKPAAVGPAGRRYRSIAARRTATGVRRANINGECIILAKMAEIIIAFNVILQSVCS